MKLTSSLHISAFLSITSLAAFSACGNGSSGDSAGAAGASTLSASGGTGGKSGSGQGGEGNQGGLFPQGGSNSGGTDTGSTTSVVPDGPCESPTPTTATTLLAKQAGGANVQAVLGVASDAQDNIAVVGNFLGSIDLGTGALNSAGNSDAFIAKLKSDGSAIWAKRYGDAGFNQYAQHVAFDQQGNMAVTGHFRGTVDFGGGGLTDISNFFEDIFIVKLDGNGGHVWSKRYGDINSEESQAIATDAQGNILVAGAFQKTINFGGGAITAEDGGFNAFAAKLSSGGDQQWAKSFGDTAAEQKALGITADKDGNVYLVGTHKGSIDFGGGALTADGTTQHAYVAKLSPAGAYVWASSFGTTEAAAVDVAVDAAGEVYVAGNFKNKINLGGKEFDAGVANNVFVLKLDKDGKHIWSRSFGKANAAEEATSLVLDGDKPVLVGIFTDSINFGGGALQSGGGFDVFLAKLDSDGCQIHADVFGGAMLQRCETLALDKAANILFGGSFDGTVDFGSGALAAEATDAYVVKTKP